MGLIQKTEFRKIGSTDSIQILVKREDLWRKSVQKTVNKNETFYWSGIIGIRYKRTLNVVFKSSVLMKYDWGKQAYILYIFIFNNGVISLFSFFDIHLQICNFWCKFWVLKIQFREKLSQKVCAMCLQNLFFFSQL